MRKSEGMNENSEIYQPKIEDSIVHDSSEVSQVQFVDTEYLKIEVPSSSE